MQPHDCVFPYRNPSPRTGISFAPQEQSQSHMIRFTLPDLIDL
jgi:hypothetical protein